MADTAFLAGATSKIVTVEAIVISTGLPYTAGTNATSGLSASYTRLGSASVAITTFANPAVGTWSSSGSTDMGFKHRGKGVYELGAPNAALAAGADAVDFAVDGIADVLFRGARVELMGANPRSAIVDADVDKINGITLQGAGTTADPFRPV